MPMDPLRQCYCGAEGDDYAKHGALDDLSCNYLCVGSSDHFCGGDMAIEVRSTCEYDMVLIHTEKDVLPPRPSLFNGWYSAEMMRR